MIELNCAKDILSRDNYFYLNLTGAISPGRKERHAYTWQLKAKLFPDSDHTSAPGCKMYLIK